MCIMCRPRRSRLGESSCWTEINDYICPAEEAFADEAYARGVASVFCDELIRNGKTTACVYCTVYPKMAWGRAAALLRHAPAGLSTPAHLEAAATLWREHLELNLQTHFAKKPRRSRVRH